MEHPIRSSQLVELPRNEKARALWARTTLRVWPGAYRLVSLDPALGEEAAQALAGSPAPFLALVRERDEISLTIAEKPWRQSPLRPRARSEAGPFRVITFELALALDVVGYLAPAAARLARAGISVVPQCAFQKDHLLVPARRVGDALRVLRGLVRDCARARMTGSRARAGRRGPRARG